MQDILCVLAQKRWFLHLALIQPAEAHGELWILEGNTRVLRRFYAGGELHFLHLRLRKQLPDRVYAAEGDTISLEDSL